MRHASKSELTLCWGSRPGYRKREYMETQRRVAMKFKYITLLLILLAATVAVAPQRRAQIDGYPLVAETSVPFAAPGKGYDGGQPID